MEFDYIFKLMVIGDPGVGKSTLLETYGNLPIQQSDYKYTPTIGVEYKIKTLQATSPSDDYRRVIKLQLFDTSGLEYFRSIRSPFYRGVHVVLILFDLTDRSTFMNVLKWYEEVLECSSNCHRILVGTKDDLDYLRSVGYTEAKEVARDMNMSYYEISSRTYARSRIKPSGVDSLFDDITHYLIEQKESTRYPLRIQSYDPPLKKSSCGMCMMWC